MSCKLPGLLWLKIILLSTNFLVPELLYKIGHNSCIHSQIGRFNGLNSVIQKKLLSSDSDFSLGNNASCYEILLHLCNAGIVKFGRYPLKLKYESN